MRKAPLVLVAAVALLAGCSSSVESTESNASPASTVDPRGGVPPGYPLDKDVATPLVITALGPDPIPVTGTDGKIHVAYEIQLFNVTPRPVTITEVETLADGPDGVVVTTVGEAEVAARTLQFPAAPVPVTDIAPGRTVVLLLDDVYDSRDDVPAEVTHRITATLGTASPGSEAFGALYPDATTQIGGAVRTSTASPVVIGPPVAGDGWIADNSCCVMNAHRGVVLALGGRMNGAERFGIDWMQTGQDNAVAVGDGTRNEDYYGYGAELLAVADGTIVTVVSDRPDVPPKILPEGVAFEQLAGNYVIIDIGDGNFAFYAHMIPGSVSVEVGDKVTRGQAIGRLGNSGNTTAPHLHFHLSRAPLPLSGDNVAYEIDRFTFIGAVDVEAAPTDEGIFVTVSEGPNAGERTNQLPLYSTLVNFRAFPDVPA
ncbi:M23 family metallopeptidase [Rhodococcus sp. KBS0724]|jgi:murein DD-endopeptidase MepM/ murein hydrolase activator NlpD|uniref:M23 family metallopeptidase n=1 Tax=Rhodococcus sp. KBS0724 TaxID=1179674 RepID=UPI00110ED9F4|nr:M23 family metallopeptidase [Rhodococcus sp. KBS0724]TSD49974.1 M23 family metallopeptidase [Rhodococcus sp. KBS0724]